MKNKFKNIDEVFQKTFDGFEANVDPSVWGNVSNAINGGLASSSTEASVTFAKTVAFKIVAGIMAVTTIVTVTYFITKDKEIGENKIVQESVISDNIVQGNQTLLIKEDNPHQNKIVVEGGTEVVSNNVKEENNSVSIKKESSIPENKTIDNSENKGIEMMSSTSSNETKKANNSDSQTNTSTSLASSKDNVDPTNTPASLPAFDVEILTTNTEGFAPLEVEFNVEGNVVSAAWDFNDGTTSNQKNTFHTFDKPGKYVVSLNVLDKNNRDKKITQTIIVKSNFPLSLNPIPNAISPNGDNQNDVFKISGENILNIEVFIMNSKGDIVCRLNSIDDVWDGKDQRNGNLVIPGTYYVSGVAKGVDGELQKIQKTITVFK